MIGCEKNCIMYKGQKPSTCSLPKKYQKACEGFMQYRAGIRDAMIDRQQAVKKASSLALLVMLESIQDSETADSQEFYKEIMAEIHVRSEKIRTRLNKEFKLED
jgi:hypothetical protein